MKKKLIVVLGMHRSGTSAITRGLRALGVSLGEHTAPGVEGENDKGFWEDVDLQELNSGMLSFLGSSWDDVTPVSADDAARLVDAGYVEQCRKLLEEKLAAEPLFGVKDPRMAKLMPFWAIVFRNADFAIGYVIALRNPLSVARSLARRNQQDPVHGYLLWADHVLASLLATEGRQRVLVDYDLLMASPEAQLQRMAAGLHLPVVREELDFYRSSFIDEGLRHAAFGVADLEADPSCPDLVKQVYAGLLAEAAEDAGKTPDPLVGAAREWHSAFRRELPVVSFVGRLIAQARQHVVREGELFESAQVKDAEMDSLRRRLDVALEELQMVRRQRDEHEQMVARITATRSWRMTRPLRLLARLLQQGLATEDRRRLGVLIRRYYQRLPIPFTVRQKISAFYRRVVRNRLAIGGGRGTEWVPPGPEIHLAPVQQGMPDYVVWGVIDWHFRHQRPQHLAQEIAESGRRVFYVSATLVDSVVPGFDVEPIGKSGRLFSVRLFVQDAPQIYSAAPSHAQAEQLRMSVGRLLAWARTTDTVSLVQHPFWLAVASVLPGVRLVYDCMDHHEGFGNVPPEMIALERALLAASDLTVTTSAWLDEIVSGKTGRRLVIRNAGEYGHFAQAPANPYVDRKGRRIIGYYGAIAEWFDVELIEKIARRFPECCVLLVGSDTVNAKGVLGKYPNVVFTGEISYTELPRYLHAFSVCLLPFRVIPLTLATNPVKVYEYLSAGKPVVVVDLPEMAQFEGLVDVARDHDEYIAAIARRLGQADDATGTTARRAFAREQTWSHRAAELVAHAESADGDPLVSVIVVTYNNIELTRACLSSLDAHSHYENMEIIVVDNASSDGSPEFLSEWASRGGNRKLVLNAKNKGFAAGNNDGLAIASGEYLVLLNNDTYVTPGWIRTMVNHVRRDKTIGLLGPVTNNIGNEARIDIVYDSMAEMQRRSAEYTRNHLGRTFRLHTAAFFCVMIPRSTYERVGPLDEAFGRGFFEDDDYCRRVEELGLRIACAEDVFIHHHLSASFNKLKLQDRQRLFEENRKIYEAKWGPWVPHGYRDASPVAQAEKAVLEPVFPVGGKYLAGRCGVCGRQTRYHYADESVWRESLACEHCLTTSRYRSVGRGVLRAISEACGIRVDSLAELPRHCDRRLRVYDTQPPFYYLTCAYPLPDLLRATGWIDVCLSQYKPSRPAGERIAPDITNQNLECLTFPDEYFDIVITSDVMEHVRLDANAHREIHRVLKPGGVYVFTVPHDRHREETLVRVQVTDPGNPDADVHLLEPEYHGDTNSDDGGGVLSYRVYGRDLEAMLASLGFDVQYIRTDLPAEGIMSTELYYCRKVDALTSWQRG